jgi:hypothetical protein
MAGKCYTLPTEGAANVGPLNLRALDICAAPWLLRARKDARKPSLRKSVQRTIRFESLFVGKNALLRSAPETSFEIGSIA